MDAPWEKYQDSSPSPVQPQAEVTPENGPWSKYGTSISTNTGDQGRPLFPQMTSQQKIDHPVLAAIDQSAQDVATLGEKAANGLTLGALDYGLKKANIQPPNFDNTAPENKSGLKLAGDAVSLGAGNKTLGVIGSKVFVPVAKGISKAVPEGLKQSSYALMQSIVNQLPKEFKYGANAGRSMVKEKFSGDASDIKEQADQRLKEIGGEGDKLASSSNTPIDNSNAMKVIDDKIAELQAKSPRTSAGTIKKLQDSKDDLLGVKEGVDENGNKIILDQGKDVSNMTPQETLDLKRNFDDHTAWKGTASDDTVYNKTMQVARTNLKNNLNDTVDGMKDWNQRYADLRAAQQAAGRRVTYDQAGTGMANILNHFVRGSVGMSTLGAALTGHGELAGEILAGWGAKEVLGNPMVKSKVAQMLYGLSEADKSDIFKVVPWVKRAIFTPKSPMGKPIDIPPNIPNPNSFNPSTMNVPNKLAIGTGTLGTSSVMGNNKANASQNIDMNRIYKIESSNNPNAYNSSSKATGLGQITPIVVKDWNNMHPKEKYNLLQMRKPDLNRKISDWYMNKRIPQLLNSYGLEDNTRNRLISYNAGINYVKNRLPLKIETINYIKKYGE